jgi:hypothetical protein
MIIIDQGHGLVIRRQVGLSGGCLYSSRTSLAPPLLMATTLPTLTIICRARLDVLFQDSWPLGFCASVFLFP